MYSAEAFIKCTNDKIKRMEASVNHLDESSKKLAQHNKQLEKQLGVSQLLSYAALSHAINFWRRQRAILCLE